MLSVWCCFRRGERAAICHANTAREARTAARRHRRKTGEHLDVRRVKADPFSRPFQVIHELRMVTIRDDALIPLVDELAREWRPGRDGAADEVMRQLIEARDSLLQGSAS